MPTSQPDIRDVHVNAMLTNMSVAYVQDQKNFVAPKLGVVPVEKQTDIVLKYGKHAFLRDEFKLRAPGTIPQGSGFTLDITTTYRCEEYSGEIMIPDELKANADSPINFERDAMALKVQQALIRWDYLWHANIFTTGWGKDLTGVTAAAGATEGTSCVYWSDMTNSDPLVDMAYAVKYILSQTGLNPNTLVLGYEVWEKLKNHPVITERYKHTSADAITEDMVARLFEVEKIIVSRSVYSSSIEGTTTPTYGFVGGKHALLAYVEKSPAILKPSAWYSFAWKGIGGSAAPNGLGLAVFKGRDDRARADWMQVSLCVDPQVIATDCGVFFNGIVA